MVILSLSKGERTTGTGSDGSTRPDMLAGARTDGQRRGVAAGRPSRKSLSQRNKKKGMIERWPAAPSRCRPSCINQPVSPAMPNFFETVPLVRPLVALPPAPPPLPS